MAGAVAVQVAREEVFENFQESARTATGPASGAPRQKQPPVAAVRSSSCVEAREDVVAVTASGDDSLGSATVPTARVSQEPGAGSAVGADEAGGRGPAITVARHSRLAPYKPGKMTVVLDMDECLLHSKFHGPGAASEAYRQMEDRPDAVNEVNSFWVALDDGDTAQVREQIMYRETGRLAEGDITCHLVVRVLLLPERARALCACFYVA